MCLVVVAHDATPRYPFVLAANRDELHTRPSRPAGWWPERPGLLGGRDLLAGGTWLGVDRQARVAAVTNVRDGTPRAAPQSRGVLVTGYLCGSEPAGVFATRITAPDAGFAAFNLLLFDGAELRAASNRAASRQLPPGIHAFSNAALGEEWPKTRSAKAGLAAGMDENEPVEALFALLAQQADDGPAEEHYRRSHFIRGAVYGTRCSTVVVIDRAGTLTFAERSFDAGGAVIGEVRERFAVARP